MTKDEFNDLWELNPNGNYEDAFTIVNIHIDTNGMGKGGKKGLPVSAKMIHEAYKAYTEQWNRNFGKKNPQFIKADDQLKNLQQFVVDRLYINSYESFRTTRDYYLFRDLSDEQIAKIGSSQI